MSTAPQRPSASIGSVRNVSISFAEQLCAGELLTGTPTVVEDTSSDLTIISKAISTSAKQINDVTVPTGEAVQCNVSGFANNFPYTLNISCDTDADPPQTLKGRIVITEAR